MALLEKKNRSRVACNRCRDSKIRCVNFGDHNACVRCLKLKLSCSYSPTLAQQRQKPNKPEHHDKVQRTPPAQVVWKRSEFVEDVKFPSKEVVLELVEIFFENQYKGIFPFIHKPSFLAFLNSNRFSPETYFDDYNAIIEDKESIKRMKFPDPILLVSILALCCRFYPLLAQSTECSSSTSNTLTHTEYFQRSLGMTPTEASKYYGEQARYLLKEVFDEPTVQRIQALVLLSSHEWGEGNSARSFVYVGIAARMALILGLGAEVNLPDEGGVLDENEQLIYIESRRRTIWSIYMMDRCNSSGRNRSSAIKVSDIEVNLPCEEREFLFGIPGKTLRYNDIIVRIKSKDIVSMQQMPVCNFTIVVFEIWSKVARWVGEMDGKLNRSRNLNSDETYSQLTAELKHLQESLPNHLKFNEHNLQAHISHFDGAHFGYFHALLLLCDIFLLRETFFCGQTALPSGCWKLSLLQMLNLLKDLTLLISTLKRKNMMVIAPFTAFEVFTASISGLFFYAYPNQILKKQFLLEDRGKDDEVINAEIQEIKEGFRSVAYSNMDMLVDWANSWELAKRWYHSINKLGQVFESCLSENTSLLENESIRHEIQDYGDGTVGEIHTTVKTRRVSIQNLLASNSGSEYLPEKSGSDSTLNVQDFRHGDDFYIKLIPSPVLDIFSSSASPGFMQRFDTEWENIDRL